MGEKEKPQAKNWRKYLINQQLIKFHERDYFLWLFRQRRIPDWIREKARGCVIYRRNHVHFTVYIIPKFPIKFLIFVGVFYRWVH